MLTKDEIYLIMRMMPAFIVKKTLSTKEVQATAELQSKLIKMLEKAE